MTDDLKAREGARLAEEITASAAAHAKVRENDTIETWCDRCRLDRQHVTPETFERMRDVQCTAESVRIADHFDGFEAVVFAAGEPLIGVILQYEPGPDGMLRITRVDESKPHRSPYADAFRERQRYLADIRANAGKLGTIGGPPNTKADPKPERVLCPKCGGTQWEAWGFHAARECEKCGARGYIEVKADPPAEPSLQDAVNHGRSLTAMERRARQSTCEHGTRYADYCGRCDWMSKSHGPTTDPCIGAVDARRALRDRALAAMERRRVRDEAYRTDLRLIHSPLGRLEHIMLLVEEVALTRDAAIALIREEGDPA